MFAILIVTYVLVLPSAILAQFNVVEVLSTVKVTDGCKSELIAYISNFLEPAGNPWALQMLDATSKLQSGLLSFNFGSMGDFNECIRAKSSTKEDAIRGKYCFGYFDLQPNMTTELLNMINARKLAARVTNQHMQVRKEGDKSSNGIALLPSWALCLPSSCTTADFNKVGDSIFANLPIDVTFADLYCQTEEDTNPLLSTGAILTITFFVVIILIMIVSSLYDYSNFYLEKEPKHKILVAFSIYTNVQKLFKFSKANADQLPCLNGIRFLSIVWVIAGHAHSIVISAPLSNAKDALDWANSLKSMFIVSGTFSVDTFFVVGGCLLMYGYLKSQSKGIKFNVPVFYLHRYIRLTPALAAVVLVSATSLKYMGSGPKWQEFVMSFQNNCRKHWWTTLLYVQNYVNVGEMCIGQTWYLNIDTQLYLLSPLLLIPLQRKPKLAIPVVVALIIASMSYSFYVAWDKELTAILSNLNGNSNDYMNELYLLTHTRASPWLTGFILGLVITNEKDQKHRKINKKIVLIAWAVCLCLLGVCIFAGHSTLRGVEYDKWGNALYIAFMRPTWGFCIAWIIYACVTNNAGPINWILSLPIFQVMNRFTYSMYLLHVTLRYMMVYAVKQPLYFSLVDLSYSFWGLFMFSFILSIFWVLAFESPMIIIEKIIFGKS